jgi:diguanylate cyclase (GGDEF)-like protein
LNEPAAQREEKVAPEEDRAARSRLHRLHRLLEPPILFSGIAVLLLAVIGSVTFNLTARDRLAAERAAAALTMDLADTYEAQVVRALREIDNTLKLVRYTLGAREAQVVLEELHTKELLPPEILFTVNLADARGNVIAGTRPAGGENIAALDYFQRAREEEGMVIGAPWREPGAEEWRLTFSRRIEDAGQRFAGVVTVSVHAGYFVSVYEAADLGEHGVLGLVGTDGVFRARRSGEAISAGTTLDYNALVPEGGAEDAPAAVLLNPWDNTRRYTVARKLYAFPLAIVVGLAEAEQLAPARRIARTYLWRAALASLLLVTVVALLGRLSWQLQRARTRAMEERVAHARRVEYLAYHDNLTALPNRALFSRLLTQGMQHARRYEKQLALLFLDLDHFKAINDSLGHETGDELLQELGERLRQAVRESDIVARLGGDEFVILLPEIREGAQVQPVADKILAAVGRPFILAGQEFRITISIGIALYPHDGEDEQTLMKNADTAMYYAKERGRNNFQFYSEKLNSDSLERLAMESSMRKALQNNEFRLFYQSKHDVRSGRVTGIEALLCWQHPDLGLIAPMQFIPLAEENGLIVAIGRWVFDTALRQNVAWQKEGLPRLSMAVNLTARQFLDDNLVLDIRNALRESGMAPELLELEITETMIMHDMQATLRILQEIKQMGVRIAIDNFGTGYSSLSKLKGFPLDTIKIDGSFIHDAAGGSEGQSLTGAIIELGKSLGFTVLAEGVESKEQVDYLRLHACDQYQGFYSNKPMPAQEFAAVVREQLRESAPAPHP